MSGLVTSLGAAAVSVAVGLLVTACGPSRLAAPPVVVSPGGAAPTTEPDRAAALESTLAAEGLRVKVSSHDGGRHVAMLRFEDAPPRSLPWRHQLQEWLARHGSSLGYGALGAFRWGRSEYSSTLPAGVLSFPDAEACPGLFMEAAFEIQPLSPGLAPLVVHVACPSEARAQAKIAEAHALIVRLRQEREESKRELLAARLAADPLVVALRGTGLSVKSVHRHHGRVRAVMNRVPVPADRDRLAYVSALAERVRMAEGLPPLDPSVEITVVDDGDGFAVATIEVDVGN